MATNRNRFDEIVAELDASSSGELTSTQKGELRALRAASPELAGAIDILTGEKPVPSAPGPDDKYERGIVRGRAAAASAPDSDAATYPILNQQSPESGYPILED